MAAGTHHHGARGARPRAATARRNRRNRPGARGRAGTTRVLRNVVASRFDVWGLGCRPANVTLITSTGARRTGARNLGREHRRGRETQGHRVPDAWEVPAANLETSITCGLLRASSEACCGSSQLSTYDDST